MLNAPAGVHLDVARVHSYRHRDLEDALGCDNALDHPFVETKEGARGLDERRHAKPRIELVRRGFVGVRDHLGTSLLLDTKATGLLAPA